MSWLVFLLACGGGKHVEAPAEPVEEPIAEPAPEPEPPPAPTTFVGSWSSASCGDRTYERQLKVATDGTWAAMDLVSPCPPGAMCVWSGIVPTNGTWAADGEAITLAFDGALPAQVKALPTRLALVPDGLLAAVEGETCEYQAMAPEPQAP